MEPVQCNPKVSLPPENVLDASSPTSTEQDSTAKGTSSMLSASGLSSWAKSLRISQPAGHGDAPSSGAGKSTFAHLTSGFSLHLSPKDHQSEESVDSTTMTTQPGVFGSLTRGLVDSSKNVVKAVSIKVRHIVSQNKRRYQEGGFDLDMTYITETIIAMGFPAGDMSSGFFGYVEGFYRNRMEEVIKFFETYHKVASFPFDDHNCPPIQLIMSFCQSAYSWLKEDIENVVVVHCKAGMARTGLMISSLLLYLKFFPTAEESMDYYNQKRCLDGKGLILPSQIRYVKYFERILTYFGGENQPGRRCMLKGFRLHSCPYWVRPSITVSNHNGVLFSTKRHPRTKDLMPEDFWFSAPKKGIMVFALLGEPGLAEVSGDFKIQFHERQGDFYCWLNTTLIENRTTLNPADLDCFDKRKLPSPGFQLEVVLIDYSGTIPSRPPTTLKKESDQGSGTSSVNSDHFAAAPRTDQESRRKNKDDVFSDSDSEEPGSAKNKRSQGPETGGKGSEAKPLPEESALSGDHGQGSSKDDVAKQASVAKESKHESIVTQRRSLKVQSSIQLVPVSLRQLQLTLQSLALEMKKITKVSDGRLRLCGQKFKLSCTVGQFDLSFSTTSRKQHSRLNVNTTMDQKAPPSNGCST